MTTPVTPPVTDLEGSAPPATDPEQPKLLRYRAAFQQIKPDADQLDPQALLIVNIDMTSAVSIATGALPKIMALRDQAAAQLPQFEIRHFDTLETLALATMHVQGEFVAASAPAGALALLYQQGVALRELLHSDATSLTRRGLMNGSKLSKFRVSPGYKILAEDLVGISSLLRNNWPSIGSKTAITLAELDEAEELSDRLLSALAARAQAPAILASAAIQRQRVFTLFVAAYDEVRRAITFLRWKEGDLETVAPSLYSGRGNVRRKKSEAPPVAPAEHPEPAPAVSPAQTGVDRLPQ